MTKETNINLEELDTDTKLNIVIEALAQIANTLDELVEGQAELAEKVHNINLGEYEESLLGLPN